MKGRPAKYSADILREMQDLWEEGDLTALEIGKKFGLSKSTVLGLAHRHEWSPRGEPGRIPTTLPQRMDALNARMDQVLRETEGLDKATRIISDAKSKLSIYR